MKKLLLATVLAGTSTLAFAKIDTSNLYVQGNVGVSKLEVKEDGEKFKDNNAGFSIAVGKDTGAIRYQADYTNFGKVEESFTNGTSNTAGYEEWTATLKTQSLGLSAIYDFQTTANLTPYAGVRVGINQLKIESDGSYLDSQLAPVYHNDSEKKTKVGAGVLAGVQYAINPQFAVDAGVEYNYLGKVEDTKVSQYGAKVGLRYNF